MRVTRVRIKKKSPLTENPQTTKEKVPGPRKSVKVPKGGVGKKGKNVAMDPKRAARTGEYVCSTSGL